LHSTKWSDGKKKKRWKPLSSEKKKNIYIYKMQDSEENEENRYPVPDPNKIKVNNTKEPSDAQKKSSKKKSCK
jgi:hypothetical protein